MPNSNTAFVPDMAGKTVIVTGANSGIGFAVAKVLAERGGRVVFAVRDLDKGKRAADAVRGVTEVRILDLADLDSVRAFARAWDGPIDLLINNAGVSAQSLSRTADGFELVFGTNHLGPFALTNLLLPNIVDRIVSLGSRAEVLGRINFDDLNLERTSYKGFRAYATSKLANHLFTAELQRRLTAAGSRVIATVAHPGFVATSIYDKATGLATRLMVRYMSQNPEMGALPVLYAAVADIPGNSFVGPKDFMHMRGAPELIKSAKVAEDGELATRLWKASEEMTGVQFGLQTSNQSEILANMRRNAARPH